MSYFKTTSLVDSHNFPIHATPMDQMQVAETYRLSGGSFSDSIVETNFFTSVTASSGSVTISQGEVNLAVIGASSSAQVDTKSVGRYVSTNANFFRGTNRLNNLTATNNSRKWGVRDLAKQNGFYFVFKDGVFGIASLLAGSETPVWSGSFNGDETTHVPDLNYHLYRIYFTTTKVWFYCDDKLIHYLVATTAPITSNRNFVVFGSNINTASATGTCNIYSTAMSLSRLGASFTQSKFLNLTTAGTYVLKGSPSRLHKVVVNQRTATTLTLYDYTSASGTLIGTMDLSGGAVQGNAVGAYVYDVDTNIGLTAVLSGTSDVTVIYE